MVGALRKILITLLTATGLVGLYFFDPEITPTSYVLLAPWLHGGESHLLQNLLVFLLVGSWTEQQTSRQQYVVFIITAGYLSLYLPIVLDFGGLSRGASGITKALTANFGLVQLRNVLGPVDSPDDGISEYGKLAMHVGLFGIVLFYSLRTVLRFFNYLPSPEGIAVGAHFAGLALGSIWFGYRTIVERSR